MKASQGSRRKELDRPLRRDVGLLGRLLGDVLVEQEGNELFATEERIRALSIARRRGPREQRAASAAELIDTLSRLPIDRAEKVIRAFATYFRLVNVAEQHHRIRRARAHAKSRTAEPQRGSLAAVLSSARAAGVDPDEARRAIAELEVTLTVTAHPTEAARRTILEKLSRIAHAIDERDRKTQTAGEADETVVAMREEITALWQTDALRRERPSVGDEVKNVLWYVETVLWDLLPEISASLARAFERAYGEPLGVSSRPVRLHSWVGGDMDGNPNVTPDILEDAIRAYEIRGLRKLHAAVRDLGSRLSQSSRYVRVPPELSESIGEDERRMPWIAEEQERRTAGEPWRRKLRFVETRIAATLRRAESARWAARTDALSASETDAPPSPSITFADGESALNRDEIARYEGPAALARDLGIVADTLRAANAARAGERQARALFERVRSSGFSIVEIEMRVPAADVSDAAAGTFGDDPNSGASRVVASLERIARLQQRSGEAACRTLVLSMTRNANDILDALRCARDAGLWDESRSALRLDIVPLFETKAALDGSSDIMRACFADSTYRNHVVRRGTQEVMIGYSDSAKEIGLLAASAALWHVQRDLLAVAAETKIPIRFFHGRGESVARGGGPSQQAILALPPGSVGGRYKATEQGEALDHKYGRPELAMRTLELVVGGALLHSLGAQPRPAAADESRFVDAFDRLARAGQIAYRALVEAPDFVPFFTAATPVEEIANLNIGSRPSKRSAGGLSALRAIPWVFAWTQNRALVPGWYGVGSGLEAVGSERGGRELLRAMYREWPFFRMVLDNVEMVLAKSDLDIASRYVELVPSAIRDAVWAPIVDEHKRTAAWLHDLQGTKKLLQNNPTLSRSISVRNPYVDPMSFLQVELIARKRAGEDRCDRPLLLTIQGIAAGMRNTG